ncbi:DNA polymerase III subunit [Aegicerativicinus sediminis]
MLFKDVLGLPHIKSHLTKSADLGRIPHAQLFVGPEGCGTLPMAIAYARYLLCNNVDGENTGGNPSCNLKFDNLSHPDLHFVFPVATNDKIKKHPVSSMFMDEWRQLLKEQPYGNLFDWYQIIGIENKQGLISVDEAQDIVKALSLKSYEGGYKVMIIWMAEKMNTQTANKLLKLIEEPPQKTVFLLICEEEQQILKTIRSRCQILHFPALAETDIIEGLKKSFQLDDGVAQNIAQQAHGNFNKACDLVYQDSEDQRFEEWFIQWVRAAFRAKGNKGAIHDLMNWSEDIAKNGREIQKQFLLYCLDFFRQAMLMNYQIDNMVYLQPVSANFKLEKFAPFIHEGNIVPISTEIQDAYYHVERNGNSKIIFSDLSIKLTRLLHKKAG